MKLENLPRANQLDKQRNKCLKRIRHQERAIYELKSNNTHYGALVGQDKVADVDNQIIHLIYGQCNENNETFDLIATINVDIFIKALEENVETLKARLEEIDKEIETL